ncbi:MAG: hypothetical protein ACJ71W_05930 [Terriglobales bacterium]
MANSSAKKQGIASHLRRLALLHGYQARTNRLAGYQPMQNHGERVALISPAPAPAPQLACKKKSGCGCGGRCKKKNLIPAAAALNSHMRRNGKTLGDLGFDFSDFADSFSKVTTGVTDAIGAARGINKDPNSKKDQKNGDGKNGGGQPIVSSLPPWLLPAGAAAGGVALIVALMRR